MKRIAFLLAALASCGPEPQPRQPDTLPMPSGPPLAQQAAPQPPSPAPTPASPWESLVRGDRMTLRLVEDGVVRMEMSCLGGPPRLAVQVPGFSTIGSEDRFSLGLGDEPVTLVADIERKDGVAAEAPVPANFEALLEEADEITALYGTQRIGPVPPPPGQLTDALVQACRTLAD